MALQKDTIARDSVEINGYFIEDLIGGGRFNTLTSTGREQNTYNPETGIYEARTITIKYVLSCPNESIFRTLATYLQHILNRVDADITFNDEYDKFLIGNIRDKGFTEKHGTWALGEYEIVCKTPFKFSKEVKTQTMVVEAGRNDIQNTASFRYAGTVVTNPIIKINMSKKANNYGLIDFSASNSFFNIVNSKTGQSCYIGNLGVGSNIATSVFNLDMTSSNVTVNSFRANGWSSNSGASATINTYNDANFAKGQGLSYKGLVPTAYVDTSENWRELGCILTKDYNNLDNFIFSYNMRMYADSPTKCGAMGLYLTSTRSSKTGIYLVKDNMSSIKGRAYYIVDDKIMGSDIVDFSTYNDNFGMSSKYQVLSNTLAEGGRRYFADEVVNKQRDLTGIIEQKVVAGYIYNEPNTNISISKFGDLYTFKIGKNITRTYAYKREDGQVLTYSSTSIGFKNNVFYSTAYASEYTMNMQLTGISLIKYDSSVILDNRDMLSGGDCYILNTKNNSMYRTRLAEKGLYCPEYIQQDSTIGELSIDHQTQKLTAEYFATDSDAQPTIEVKYNEVYV